MDRLETRELAYFVAVAEELSFRRAAERLGLAQPPLSRAIKQLERRIGVPLLDRTEQRVALTPAGRVLLVEARKALDAVTAAALRARRAATPGPQLVLAMKPGGDSGLLQDILVEYQQQPCAVPVEVAICGLGEQPGMLRDGRADIAILHRRHGFADCFAGLDTEELVQHEPVAVLPRGHRLANRASLCLADLQSEPTPCWPSRPGDLAAEPDIRDVAQLMQLIALGQTIAVLPETVRLHVRRDLVCVPVIGAPRTTLVAAWPEDSRSPALAAFVRTAVAVARRSDRATANGYRLGAASDRSDGAAVSLLSPPNPPGIAAIPRVAGSAASGTHESGAAPRCCSLGRAYARSPGS